MIRYLHEAGIEVVAYERNEHVGGIWKLKTARGAVPQMPTIGSSRTDYIPEVRTLSPWIHTDPLPAARELERFPYSENYR